MTKTLDSTQIQQFVDEGVLVLRGCFAREAAQPLVDEAWRLFGYDPQDRGTWEKPIGFVFPETDVKLSELAPPLWAAICELCGGEERLSTPDYGIGQWVVNFHNGHDEPYVPPGPQTRGWHVDGIHFRHFLDSPEQGLLVVPLFSDVLPRGGGTVYAADSVPIVARFLAAHPEGIGAGQFGISRLVEQCRDFREITGEVGDAVIFHPYMLHSSSQNQRAEPRFISNLCVALREPMKFDRANDGYSPVEEGVLRALGVEKLDFRIEGERGAP